MDSPGQIRRAALALVVLVSAVLAKSPAGSNSAGSLPPNRETYQKLAGEVEASLRRDVLDVWFPRCVDQEHGGFASSFSREWQPGESQGKFSVFQARMTWITAQVAMRRPEMKERFLPLASHGIEFLANVLWDKQFGGFFWGVDDAGRLSPAFGDRKELYGESFALYGAAAAYQATRDPKALALAQKAFRWIDEHAHDARHGGYFELLTREGKPVEANAADRPPNQGGFLPGYKSMNTHIHLLEAFTQLYEVWKDPTVGNRLEEMLAIVRDKICVFPGVMNLFFTNDWRPIPGHDSYGHDIETAYLMLESEQVLGRGHSPETERMARLLVDHALAYGFDDKLGGFYSEGPTFGKSEETVKIWWVEMEGLNSLLLMHENYGRETEVYFKAFQKQWDFIRTHQADSKFHGFYEAVDANGAPTAGAKGHIWKAGYHDGRALLNVSERLNRLAAASPQAGAHK